MTVNFRVKAVGYPPPITYQWQISDGSGGAIDLENDSTYQGVTTKTLSVRIIDNLQSGSRFRARAATIYQDKFSRFATLTVNIS